MLPIFKKQKNLYFLCYYQLFFSIQEFQLLWCCYGKCMVQSTVICWSFWTKICQVLELIFGISEVSQFSWVQITVYFPKPHRGLSESWDLGTNNISLIFCASKDRMVKFPPASPSPLIRIWELAFKMACVEQVFSIQPPVFPWKANGRTKVELTLLLTL